MRKLIFLFLPIFLFAIENPYKQLEVDEKINLLLNYFLNKDLKTKMPTKPIKETIKDNSLINPIQYELYFSYIQRLKTINESRTDEQKEISEKYNWEIKEYNKKLNELKKHYSKDENLLPILQNNFNKVYKILYGKPKLKNVYYNKSIDKVIATIWVDTIYGYNKFKDKTIHIDLPTSHRDKFIEFYREAKVQILFDHTDNLLKLKGVEFLFQDKIYKGNFIDKTNNSIKLVIKINNDIFQLVKIED
ncbi:MAG: hypothetical protein U9R16_01360 [Campylobacterota bacterium]|nr:hypothetical protein [Campylobacterota bacterium]